MKRCSGCKEELDLENFSKNKRTKDGHSCYCKICVKAINREQYLKNQERRKAEARQYRAENAETVRERDRARGQTEKRKAQRREREKSPDRIERRLEVGQQWRSRNPNYHKDWRRNSLTRLAYERKHYRDNIERYRATNRRLRREKPEAYRISKHKYRSRVRSTHIPRTPEQWQAKFDYWGRRCWICKADLDGSSYHIDHVKPINKGGMDCLANLRPACGSCNRSKSDRWPFKPKAA